MCKSPLDNILELLKTMSDDELVEATSYEAPDGKKFKQYMDTLGAVSVDEYGRFLKVDATDLLESRSVAQEFIDSLSEEQKNDIAKQISGFAREFRGGK